MFKRIDSGKIPCNPAGEGKKVLKVTGEIVKIVVEKGNLDLLAEIRCFNEDEETVFSLKELKEGKTTIYPRHSVNVAEQIQLEGSENDSIERYVNEGPLYVEILNGGEKGVLKNVSFVFSS